MIDEYLSYDGVDTSEGFHYSRREYDYDENGNVLTCAFYYNETAESGYNEEWPSLSMSDAYTYSEDGKLLSVERIYTHIDIVRSETYEYDENGNIASYRLSEPTADGTEVIESGTNYTYREFYLTEEEIAQALKNDAIIEWHIPYYNTYLN